MILDDLEKRCLHFFLKTCWGSLKDPENRDYKPQIVFDETLDDFLSFLGKGEIPQKYTFIESWATYLATRKPLEWAEDEEMAYRNLFNEPKMKLPNE